MTTQVSAPRNSASQSDSKCKYIGYVVLVLMLCIELVVILYLILYVPSSPSCNLNQLSDDTNRYRNINGMVPMGELKPLDNTTVVLDIINSDNQRVRVSRGIRRSGTRVGIHIHRYGGYTIILNGTMTDYVEGKTLKQYGPNSGYYMPPCTPMSASNLGMQDVELLDIFIGPPGQPYIEILEPDWSYE